MSILYIVGTPIGNLGDLSPRALEVLKSVDFIAAEDTRVTQKLLNHFDIKRPMISYYEHNLRERGALIIERILKGESCAIVSDAGMPCISDPGEDLIKLCAQNLITVQAVPGPSAVITALAISGLPTSRFTFEGFLSVSKKNRTEHLNLLREERRTMVFYEAPHKLCSTLEDFSEHFGNDRKISIVRELTKIYEEVIRTTIAEAIAYFKTTKPRGEFVLVVEGFCPKETKITLEEAVQLAMEEIKKGVKATEAAKIAAGKSIFSKSEIYKKILAEE